MTSATSSNAFLEHANVTVSDPDRTAEMLVDVFGWEIRWQGSSQLGGKSIHVGVSGNGSSYLALFSSGEPADSAPSSYGVINGLNHLGVVVDDLDLAEAAILAAGYRTHSHGDYEPGQRFYFHDHDNIEFEVISYR